MPRSTTSTPLAQAERFLREALSSGPVRTIELEQRALEAGLSTRTLSRARTSLKVRAKRRGGLGAAGTWYLELP